MGSITDELNSLLNTKGSNIAEAIQEFRNGQGGVTPGADIELVTKTETIALLSSEKSGGDLLNVVGNDNTFHRLSSRDCDIGGDNIDTDSSY